MGQTTRAAIYCRISNDPEGEAVGVARQEADCRELAAKHDLEVVEVYTDNNIGASAASRKARPAYERMLLEARAGRFSTILVYSTSRLTRRPRELEDLIDLHEDSQVQFKTVVSGDYDLSTAAGITIARILASVDAGEAAQTAERLKAAHRHRAMNGKVWKSGWRPFGWADDHKTLHPVEAPILLEAVEQSMRGLAIHAIAKQWNDEGITTAAGKKWSQTGLKLVLTNPRLCGWMTYHKELVRDGDGQPVVGEWEPLITPEMFEALQAGIEKRATGKRRFSPYLLSPHLRCSKCSSTMWGGQNKKMGRYYRCKLGHMTISADRLDPQVKGMLFLHLSGCKGPTLPEGESTWAGEGRLEQVSQKISELMASYTDGRLSADLVLPEVEKLDQERQELANERKAFYREKLVAKAPTLVQAMEANVDWLDFDPQWFEENQDEVQDAFDFNGWSALLNQHVRTIFVKPYDGPHRSVWSRVDVLWDDGTNVVPIGVESPTYARRPKQTIEAVAMLEADPDLSGDALGEHFGVSRTYGYKIKRNALEVLAERKSSAAEQVALSRAHQLQPMPHQGCGATRPQSHR